MSSRLIFEDRTDSLETSVRKSQLRCVTSQKREDLFFTTSEVALVMKLTVMQTTQWTVTQVGKEVKLTSDIFMAVHTLLYASCIKVKLGSINQDF